LTFVRYQLAKKLANLAADSSAATCAGILERTGRECVELGQLGARFKDDPEGYFAASKQDWGTDDAWDKEKGTVAVAVGCPLEHERVRSIPLHPGSMNCYDGRPKRIAWSVARNGRMPMKTLRWCLLLAVVGGVSAAVAAFAAEPPLGSWDWVRTEESAGESTLPGDVGYGVIRVFRADLSYAEYRDDELYREGVFRVEDIEFGEYLIPTLYIQCGGDPEEVCSFTRSASELRLLWGVTPGGFPTYPIEYLVPSTSVETRAGSWGMVKRIFR